MDVDTSAVENDMAADAATAATSSPIHMPPFSCALSPSLTIMTNHDGSTTSNGSNKRKRRPAGTPDPDAEVVALSPRTLLESDRYICDICSQGFQRDQNLQMHRRRHKVPWKLLKRPTTDTRKRVYVCPEPTCLHHDPSHALGDLVGIKKHYRRKHSTDKQWKCDKCSKGYAVQSDYKAHLKTCGTRGHCCDCGRVFSRVESFIEHQDTCTAAKEKSALQIGTLVSGSQGHRCLADSPSSRSLSTECLSVDPSRSALSDSAVMPGGREFEYSGGEIPVTSTSSHPQQQNWMIIEDYSRELQLLPEEAAVSRGGGREATNMMMVNSSGSHHPHHNTATTAATTITNTTSTPPSPDTSGGERAETTNTPRLQLSIGPYSITEDLLRDKQGGLTMIGPFLPDGYEVKPITGTERATLYNLHNRLQRRASEGSTSSELAALLARTCADNEGAGGGIGDGLTLSSSSPPTAASCVRGGSDRSKQQCVSVSLLGGIKESSSDFGLRRRSRSPGDSHNNINRSVNNQSEMVAQRGNLKCMTATTPACNGGSHFTDLDSETTMSMQHNALNVSAWSELAAARRTKEQARMEREEAESELARAEILKKEAREQMKLASAEKSYAEHARENAKRQREIAESELMAAKRVREQAQSDIAKAQLLKEQADRFMNAVSSNRFSGMAAAGTGGEGGSKSNTTQDVHNNFNQRQTAALPSAPGSSLQNVSSSMHPQLSSFSTSSPFQISTPPRYSSSIIPVTFLGASAVCPPQIHLPPSCATVCTTAAANSTYSPSSVTEGHLHHHHHHHVRTPKPEVI